MKQQQKLICVGADKPLSCLRNKSENWYRKFKVRQVEPEPSEAERSPQAHPDFLTRQAGNPWLPGLPQRSEQVSILLPKLGFEKQHYIMGSASQIFKEFCSSKFYLGRDSHMHILYLNYTLQIDYSMCISTIRCIYKNAKQTLQAFWSGTAPLLTIHSRKMWKRKNTRTQGFRSSVVDKCTCTTINVAL